ICAAGSPHRSFEMQRAPDAVDVAGIMSNDPARVLLESSDLGLGIRISLASPDDSLVGVQLHPPEFRAIVPSTRTAANMQILAESNGVDLRDLHGLGAVDCNTSGSGKQRASNSGKRSGTGLLQEGSSVQAHGRSSFERHNTLLDRVL